MKIKALITTLVLGSSSLALAAPTTYTPYSTPAVRDHRQLPPTPAPAPVNVLPAAQYNGQFGWQRFARPVLLANDTHVAGRALITVTQNTRAFTKLELKAQSGKTDLERVLITFGNGQRQIVQLTGKQDGKINASKSLTIDLSGGARSIKSVMLIGSSGRRGSIDVIAS